MFVVALLCRFLFLPLFSPALDNVLFIDVCLFFCFFLQDKGFGPFIFFRFFFLGSSSSPNTDFFKVCKTEIWVWLGVSFVSRTLEASSRDVSEGCSRFMALCDMKRSGTPNRSRTLSLSSES